MPIPIRRKGIGALLAIGLRGIRMPVPGFPSGIVDEQVCPAHPRLQVSMHAYAHLHAFPHGNRAGRPPIIKTARIMRDLQIQILRQSPCLHSNESHQYSASRT